MLRIAAAVTLAGLGLLASRAAAPRVAFKRKKAVTRRAASQREEAVLQAVDLAPATVPASPATPTAPLLPLVLLWVAVAIALGAAALAVPDAWLGPLFLVLLLALLATTAGTLRRQQQAEQPLPPLESQREDCSWDDVARELNGTWVKDKAASDSMEAACNLMQLGGIIRTAIRLIKGVEIRIEGGQFYMAVLSGILWFKVKERYPTCGQPEQWARRDLRRGKHTGSVALTHLGPGTGSSGAGSGSNRLEGTADSGRVGVVLSMTWDDPVGGSGTDVFCSPQPGLLWVDSTVTVKGETVCYRQVYTRKN